MSPHPRARAAERSAGPLRAERRRARSGSWPPVRTPLSTPSDTPRTPGPAWVACLQGASVADFQSSPRSAGSRVHLARPVAGTAEGQNTAQSGQQSMNPRDVEAQPATTTRPNSEASRSRSAEPKPLVMPQKADVTKSDQAPPQALRRDATQGQSERLDAGRETLAPLRRTAGTIRPAFQSRPVSEPTRSNRIERDAEPAAPPVRLGSPHPLSRLRLQDRGRGLGRSLGLSGRAVPSRGTPRAGDRWTRRRQRPGPPSLRALFGLCGLTATVAVVLRTAHDPTLTNPSALTHRRRARSQLGQGHETPARQESILAYSRPSDNDLLMVGTTNVDRRRIRPRSQLTTVWRRPTARRGPSGPTRAPSASMAAGSSPRASPMTGRAGWSSR